MNFIHTLLEPIKYLIDKKANKNDVYTRDDVYTKDQVYTKNDVYTKDDVYKKDELSSVAVSGEYNDIKNIPVVPTGETIQVYAQDDLCRGETVYATDGEQVFMKYVKQLLSETTIKVQGPIAVSPSGNVIYIVQDSEDDDLYIDINVYSFNNGELTRVGSFWEMTGQGTRNVEHIAISPNGMYMIVTSQYGLRASLWKLDGTSVSYLGIVPDVNGKNIIDGQSCAVFINEGNACVIFGGSDTIQYGKSIGKIYSIENDTLTYIDSVYADGGTSLFSNDINCATLSPDGKLMVLAGVFSGRVKFYSVDGTSIKYISDSPTGSTEFAGQAIFTPNGKKLFIARYRFIEVYDVSGLQFAYSHQMTTNVNKTLYIAMSTDGSLLLHFNDLGGTGPYSCLYALTETDETYIGAIYANECGSVSGIVGGRFAFLPNGELIRGYYNEGVYLYTPNQFNATLALDNIPNNTDYYVGLAVTDILKGEVGQIYKQAKIKNIIPHVTTAHQQLVTDADGVAKWEDKPFGEIVGVRETTIFSETIESAYTEVQKPWNYAEIFNCKDAIVYYNGSLDRYDVVVTEKSNPFVGDFKQFTIGDANLSDLPFYISGSDSGGLSSVYVKVRDANASIRVNVDKPYYTTVPEEFIPTTVPVIQSAQVGQAVVVKTIDANGKPIEWETIEYTASNIGADASGTAATAVSNHNVATDAHNDIRDLITGLTTRLNTLADSDDTTLDQLSEIVAYIKSNKTLIENVTTNKVNVSDIVDNLTTNVANKPLSAAQGVALKALIDAITVPSKLSDLTEDSTHRTVTDAEKTTWNAKSNFSGNYNDLTNKPTNVSAFTNDAGYLTEHQDLSNYATKAYLEQYVNESILGGEW